MYVRMHFLHHSKSCPIFLNAGGTIVFLLHSRARFCFDVFVLAMRLSILVICEIVAALHLMRSHSEIYMKYDVLRNHFPFN